MTAARTQETLPPPVDAAYLLISGFCYQDAQGRRWVDALWHRDLICHLEYLRTFTLGGALCRGDPPDGSVCIDNDPAFKNVRYVDLPAPRSICTGLLMLPLTAFRLWRAIGRAQAVHSCVDDRPIPYGCIAALLARLRSRRVIVYIDAAHWRLSVPAEATVKRRLRQWISERLARLCVRMAHLRFFTHEGYRDEFLPGHPEEGHVIPSSWIDEEDILSPAQAEDALRRRRQASVLRFLLASRLVLAKGPQVLLAAMKILGERGAALEADIMGDGPLRHECEQLSAALSGPARVRVLDSLPYGPEFFRSLRAYDAVIAPIVSDEQPRIVFDAFSQGLPVLGSDTPGIRMCVKEGRTGRLCAPGDPQSLADLLQWAAGHPGELARMSGACLEAARALTHRRMHLLRWRVLAEAFKSDCSGRQGIIL